MKIQFVIMVEFSNLQTILMLKYACMKPKPCVSCQLYGQTISSFIILDLGILNPSTFVETCMQIEKRRVAFNKTISSSPQY